MADKITGGCACGRVRYALADTPIFQIRCYCDDCRRASGSAFADVMMVAADRLIVTTEPRYHTVTAESGRTMSRGFCDQCGSPVLIRRADTQTIAFIQAGSLDDPALFNPQVVVFTCHAPKAWSLPDNVPSYDRVPPADLVRPIVQAHFVNRR